MKANCSYDKEHKEFYTVAHVVQTWKVDEKGHFLEEVSTDEVTHTPNIDNEWRCVVCGSLVEDFK